MVMRIPATETRSLEQIREHYNIEKELSNRLRSASKSERRQLYRSVYDELYQRVSHHPLLERTAQEDAKADVVAGQIGLLKRFLNPRVVFLELGAGDCALSLEVSKYVNKVYAVEVSEVIATNGMNRPQNFELIISDGCTIPVPDNSVDVAFSYSLMEHLHPEDAVEQLEHLYNALAPGGVYVCVTPNRLSGPTDISGYFDDVATGFHLKEYTITELSSLLKKVGFRSTSITARVKGLALMLSTFPFTCAEAVLERLPRSWGTRIAHQSLCSRLLNIRMVATKGK
jgi:SAM-dependent methyltransferase